jgi:hypothetical protein
MRVCAFQAQVVMHSDSQQRPAQKTEPHAWTYEFSSGTKFQNDPVQRVLRDGSKGFHTKPVSRSPTTLPYNILRKNAKIEYTVQTKFLAEEPHAEKESPTTKFQNDPVQRVLRDGSKGFHTKPVSRSPTTLPYNILRKNAKIEYTVQTKFLAEEPHAWTRAFFFRFSVCCSRATVVWFLAIFVALFVPRGCHIHEEEQRLRKQLDCKLH